MDNDLILYTTDDGKSQLGLRELENCQNRLQRTNKDAG